MSFVYQNRFGEMQQYITCSPMDPLKWMGAVRMRVQTADKNITTIHTTPVHQFKSCEAKNLFLQETNPSLRGFDFKPSLLTKISIIHNNASSSEKVNPLLSSHIKTQQYICLEQVWTGFACKACLICADFSPDWDETPFSLEKAILWLWIDD